MDKSIVPVNQLAVRSSTCYEFSNPNGAVVVEIEDDDASVETVEKQMENLKLNYRFDDKHVSELFKALVEDRMHSLKEIRFDIHDQFCTMKIDKTEIRLAKSENGWSITNEHKKETIKCDDPEKSIVDHLWFVLRNPDLKLVDFRILSYKDSKTENRGEWDYEKLNTLLQSMIGSIDHQLYTNILCSRGFNEDTLLSMLKHLKPGTLEVIQSNISWKEEGNHQKMKEIVETEQWKQAKIIESRGVSPLKVDDLFQYIGFWLELKSITPEDVLRVVENYFITAGLKSCTLCCIHKKYDIDAIIDFLRSRNDGSQIIQTEPVYDYNTFGYEIVKSANYVCLEGNDNSIKVRNYEII